MKEVSPRAPAAPSLALIVFVVCALGAPDTFGDAVECDWAVTSATGNEAGQTRDEIDAELKRQLAIKLRQFDRCFGQEGATAAKPSPNAALGAGQGALGDVASSGGGGQNSDDDAGERYPDSEQPDQAGGSIAAVGGEPGARGAGASAPTDPPTPGTAATASTPDGRGAPGMPGGRQRARDSVVEDDVARVLREAAEKETDPTRRAALWQEYENYVKNL